MKKNFTKPNRSAFTLIELIFVIVILGVLAATALPRFLAVGDDAKVSAELGTIGGVRTSLALSHSRWMMDNNGSNCNWDREGPGEHFSSQGYLKNLETGVSTLSGIGIQTVFSELLQEGVEDWNISKSVVDDLRYKGPASRSDSGVIATEFDIVANDYWQYSETNGTMTLRN